MHQNILLIDDSRPIHRLVTSLLSEEQVTIHSAYESRSGLVLAASLAPDLILLDVEMPGVDGFETCRELKADRETAKVPVIFLTSRATTEELVHGLDLGAIDYVTKPFKHSELLSRVRASLRTSHLMHLLEKTALLDPLTGLGNRGMLGLRYEAEVSLRVRTHHPLSVIVLDVDRFSGVNDLCGQPFGDVILRRIGETMVRVCRGEDVPCRLGSDEFAILTPNTPARDVALLAERLRVSIAKIPFICRDEPVSVTCSVGIAEAVDTFDRSMLDHAHEAFYESKKQGGNRVSIYSAHPVMRAAVA